MDKSFSIEQVNAGWIRGSLAGDGGKIFFDASYLTNFLDDFMLGLLTALGKWPADERKNVFRVEEEPAVSMWDISLMNDCFLFHVTTYKSADDREVLSDSFVSVEREKFLKDFIGEMTGILKRFGLFGFRSEWVLHEFPLSLYLMLNDAAGNNSLTVTKREGSDNCGMEYKSTDFGAELRLLEDI